MVESGVQCANTSRFCRTFQKRKTFILDDSVRLSVYYSYTCGPISRVHTETSPIQECFFSIFLSPALIFDREKGSSVPFPRRPWRRRILFTRKVVTFHCQLDVHQYERALFTKIRTHDIRPPPQDYFIKLSVGKCRVSPLNHGQWFTKRIQRAAVSRQDRTQGRARRI